LKSVNNVLIEGEETLIAVQLSILEIENIYVRVALNWNSWTI